MGCKYEVLAWMEVAPGKYEYFGVYFGNSLIAALIATVKAKRKSTAVNFGWRG